MKLTTEQITTIDKVLWEMEIRFLDIRIEMIDHVATALEGMDGDFKDNLKVYITDNQKELKKNYRRFRRNATLRAVKLLLTNMISFRFMSIVAIIYALLFADYKYEGFEEVSLKIFVIFILAMPVYWIYMGYIGFTRQRKLFSAAQRLLISMSSMVYLLSIPLHFQIEKLEMNDGIKLLYNAFVISFIIMVALTYTSLTKFYKSKYQLA